MIILIKRAFIIIKSAMMILYFFRSSRQNACFLALQKTKTQCFLAVGQKSTQLITFTKRLDDLVKYLNYLFLWLQRSSFFSVRLWLYLQGNTNFLLIKLKRNIQSSHKNIAIVFVLGSKLPYYFSERPRHTW